jgi:hypothetical protein
MLMHHVSGAGCYRLSAMLAVRSPETVHPGYNERIFLASLCRWSNQFRKMQISGEGIMLKVKATGKRARAVNSSNMFVVAVDLNVDPAVNRDSAIADAIAHNDVECRSLPFARLRK